MRDKNRIPKILKELERIWKANPDFRLGQLIVVGTKPKQPCPSVFYIEDDKLLEGLLAFENRNFLKEKSSDEIPDWQKYPKILKINPNEITLELLEEMIVLMKYHKKDIVITPRNLMELIGAPVTDKSWMLTKELHVEKLKILLAQLEEKGLLIKRELTNDYLGYKLK